MPWTKPRAKTKKNCDLCSLGDIQSPLLGAVKKITKVIEKEKNIGNAQWYQVIKNFWKSPQIPFCSSLKELWIGNEDSQSAWSLYTSCLNHGLILNNLCLSLTWPVIFFFSLSVRLVILKLVYMLRQRRFLRTISR